MQESGVPNVTGGRPIGNYQRNYAPFGDDGYIHYIDGGPYPFMELNIDLQRSSNQYTNNLNEVRVKSIISIGFIKLY